MRGVKSFSASVHDLMDAWIKSSEGARATDIYEAVLRPMQPNVVVAVIDCKAPEAGAFSVEVVRRTALQRDCWIFKLCNRKERSAFEHFRIRITSIVS